MNLINRLGIGALCLALTATASTAMADVVVVVSARSTVTTLTRSQVADIFLGRVRRFPSGTAAQPVDQAEGSPSRDEFYATFADRSPAQIKSYWSKVIFTGRGQPPAAISTAVELKRHIAANPAAIGYLDRSLLDASVREVR